MGSNLPPRRLSWFGVTDQEAATRFFLPPEYHARDVPYYFDDAPMGARIHQPDVYEIAAYLGRRHGVHHVVDLGCGRARKLAALNPEFHIVGIDVGPNIEFCAHHYSFGTWLPANLENSLPELSPDLLRDAVLICSDVIEHLRDPTHLLRFLRSALEYSPLAVLSTPDRALVRGPADFGPPGNPAHIREWTLDEFRRLLSWAGLPVEFVGLTFNNNELLQKRTILALIDPLNSASPSPAPRSFQVTAIIATFNEADIIVHAIEDLLAQGVGVYVLDNWSTDGTYECLRDRYASRLLGLERFPPSGPTAIYDWEAILLRKEEIAGKLSGDWFIHADPDEVRRSPWRGVNLRDAIFHVDRQGFNLIDHTVIEFRPVDETFLPGHDHRNHFTYFEFCRRPGCFLQERTWKAIPGWRGLADLGGHRVQVPGARVFPYKFLLQHYPIRSQLHGERKIFIERQGRLPADAEGGGRWHKHVRDLQRTNPMLWHPDSLLEYQPKRFAETYLGERLTGIGIVRPS